MQFEASCLHSATCCSRVLTVIFRDSMFMNMVGGWEAGRQPM